MTTMNSKFNSTCPFCKDKIFKGDKISNARGKWGHEVCPEIDVDENEDKRIVKVQSTFVPSNYQQAIFDFISTGNGNLAVSATAGSGKTRTIQEAIRLLPKSASWVYLVFNKKNQVEAQEKFGELTNGNIATFHSLCLNECLKLALGKLKIDDKKSYQILDSISFRDTEGECWPNVVKVVGLIKNTLTNEDNYDDLIAMINHYGLELNGDQSTVLRLAREVVKASRAMSNVIDFDDMIWFPVIKQLLFAKKYDYIFVDEVQDLNAAQIEIVLKLRGENSRVIVVGDRNQALYGFRGALDDSFDRVVTALRATELPLSLCYRNSQAVGKFINFELPQIDHKVLDTAAEGSVTTIKDTELFQHVKMGDMVVCRVNAPLVRPAFNLIRNGIKAVIMGREIGAEIVNLITKIAKKSGATTLDSALSALAEYQSREVFRLLSQGKEAIAQSLEDKCETVFALAEGCETLDDLIEKAETIFSDKEAGVVFSSVHRAKGLESDNVFVLRYDLLPHPMAVKSGKAWQIKQELNCKFVALSRAKVNLTIVEETKRDKRE